MAASYRLAAALGELIVGCPARVNACGGVLRDAPPLRRVVTRDHGGAVGGRERRQRRHYRGPRWIAMDVRRAVP